MATDREARLAEALRANLRRRKAQARGVDEAAAPAIGPGRSDTGAAPADRHDPAADQKGG